MREKLIDYSYYIPQKNGEIYTKIQKKLISNNTKTIKGYIQNTFKNKDGKPIGCYRHRVIWYYFNGEIPESYEIDHINGIKTDNRLENLRLVTPKENMNNPVTRTKMIETVWNNESRNEKIRNGNIGKIVTEEQKRKQSASMKGKKLGVKRPEHSELMKKAPRDEFGRFIKR